MQEFMAKLYKKVSFPDVIYKYMKKYYFNIQHLKNDNFVVFGKIVSQFSGRVRLHFTWLGRFELCQPFPCQENFPQKMQFFPFVSFRLKKVSYQAGQKYQGLKYDWLESCQVMAHL